MRCKTLAFSNASTAVCCARSVGVKLETLNIPASTAANIAKLTRFDSMINFPPELASACEIFYRHHSTAPCKSKHSRTPEGVRNLARGQREARNPWGFPPNSFLAPRRGARGPRPERGPGVSRDALHARLSSLHRSAV